jgi:hypothetical protein
MPLSPAFFVVHIIAHPPPTRNLRRRRLGVGMGKEQEDSSFSGEKEAKRLLSIW